MNTKDQNFSDDSSLSTNPISEEKNSKNEPFQQTSTAHVVTLIEDPYGIKTLEIADAQKSEEIEIDHDIDDALDENFDTDEFESDDLTPEDLSAPQASLDHAISHDTSNDETSDDESPIDISALRASLTQSQDSNSQDEISNSDDLEKLEADNEELEAILKELDQDLELVSIEESQEQLDSLARAIDEATQLESLQNEEQIQEATAALALAEQVAREIAEDQALAQAMTQELETSQTSNEGDAPDEALQAALPQSLDLNEMQSCIETLLFMTDKPLSLTQLQTLLGPELPYSLFQEAITELRTCYANSRHGIEIVEVAGGLQFRTKPGRAALAKKLAKVQTQRLSSGAMETLAIVAYKQPAMKEDVDKIRGVDSSYFVRQLLDKKLIHISGRSELPGRPMVYSTTDDFLQLFGLKDISALPSLRELEQMIPASQSDRPDEDPRIREMRRLVDQMNSDTSTLLNYDPREDETILKEIRERVNSIPTSTPYLEEQKALEKQAQEALTQAQALPIQPELMPQILPEISQGMEAHSPA